MISLRPSLAAALVAAFLLLIGCAQPPPSEAEASAEPIASVDARPDWADDAVIYELFVRDFTPEGTFRAVIPRLPELKALGITTIWLMPIHPVGEERRKGTLGSPYAVRDYQAVNPRFGTLGDFRALVEAVHAQGMHLIIDWVANHTAWDHAWIEAHPDWYTADATGAITHPVGTDWTDVADLDYDVPAVQSAMIEAMRFWVEDVGIDGFRCDVAELVPQPFWEAAIDTLRGVKPVLMLAEGADPWLYEAGFDVTYAWDTYHALKRIWAGAPADTLYALLEDEAETYPEGALRMRFATNHDETAWDAPPVVLFDGQAGAQAAAAAVLTLPGIPLVFNGQEVGDGQQIRLFEKDELDFSQNPATRAFYQNLLTLHGRNAALRTGTLTPLVRDPDVLLHERQEGDERVVVAVNVRPEPRTVALPPTLAAQAMRDAFTGEVLAADSTLALGAYGVRLLEPTARP